MPLFWKEIELDRITRGGIYYDLSVSPFKFVDNEVTYVFSSQKNLNRFTNLVLEHRIKISKSLTNRFNTKIYLRAISDIVLYKNIEKRGFLIKLENGGEVRCQESVAVDSDNLILID